MLLHVIHAQAKVVVAHALMVFIFYRINAYLFVQLATIFQEFYANNVLVTVVVVLMGLLAFNVILTTY